MLKIKTMLSLILVVVIVICMSGCSRDKVNVLSQKVGEKIQNVSVQGEDKNLYVSSKPGDDFVRVSRSDMTVLYFDQRNYSVSVYDANSKKLWNSLPSTIEGERAAMVSVSLLIDGNTYVLNSQDDSLAKDTVSYDIDDNTIRINYTFKKELSNGVKIDFTVPLEFVVEDGKVSVSMDCSKLYENQDKSEVIIKSINLMNYFGANTNETKGDYIIIPDGSGAKISTAEKSEKFTPISTKVYGNDLGANQAQTTSNAIVACFGMKVDQSAFVTLIEKGEEIATITAAKALESGSYNKVGASFELTSTSTSEDKSEVYYSNNSFDGEIKMSYRLLSDDNANYVSMASAARELLIRNGTLTNSSVSVGTEMPVNVTLVGSALTQETEGKTSIKSLTTYAQAYEMVDFLKSKKLNTMNIRYKGILDGSNAQHEISSADFMSKLGKASELDKLLELALAQNGIDMYLDVNLISANVDKSFKSNAMNLTDETIAYSASKLKYQEESLADLSLSSIGLIEENTNKFLNDIRSTDFSGVCLSDVGKVLYSNNANDSTSSRQDAKDIISSQVSAVASNKNLMIDYGNIYTIKHADNVINLPDTTSVENVEYTTSVPFIQIILHGNVEYSSSPANLQGNLAKAMLKDIEYGSLLSFEWYYENLEDDYFYMKDTAQIQAYYAAANASLNDLRGERITNHYYVQSGVYCTEYNGTTKVYVNYNEERITLGAVVIEPMSFIRVN